MKLWGPSQLLIPRTGRPENFWIIQTVSRLHSSDSSEPGVIITLCDGDEIQMSPIAMDEFKEIENYVGFGVAMASSLHEIDISDVPHMVSTYKGGAIPIEP